MIEVARKPHGRTVLALLPPLPFLMLASLMLATARHLYRWRIIGCRELGLAFTTANGLCRFGMILWRQRRARYIGQRTRCRSLTHHDFMQD